MRSQQSCRVTDIYSLTSIFADLSKAPLTHATPPSLTAKNILYIHLLRLIEPSRTSHNKPLLARWSWQIYFVELPGNLAPPVTHRRWWVKQEQARGPALQRCRPQVWTGVWVHCHSGMGAGPGAQLRGVALTCCYPSAPRWNTESWGSRPREEAEPDRVGRRC